MTIFCILILWSLLEFVNSYIIVNYILELGKIKKSNIAICLRMAVFWAVVIGYGIVIESNSKSILLTSLLTIFMYIKSGIALSSFFDMKVKHISLIAFFVGIVSFVGTNILLWLPFIPIDMGSGFLKELISEMLFAIVLSILMVLRRNNLLKIYIVELSVADNLIAIIILFSMGVVESYLYHTNAISLRIKTVIVLAILANVIMLVRTLLIVRKKKAVETINILLEEQIGRVTEYYNDLIEKDGQARKFRHDIKNLLIVLHQMILENQNDKAVKYIEELFEICNSSKAKFDTGNIMADAILNEKSVRAEQKGIEIKIDGFIPSEKINDVDMVVVLSNILDNAIEACEKLQGEKTIFLHSVYRKNIWVLNAENPSNPVYPKNNEIATTKDEKEIHGFGLSNIERTVKKYDGKMTLKYEDGKFINSVTFMFD
ncbi:GHKL domain-containing protein [Butyrivibrio fibrisolvens]|uniref:sensor histidine kinase n=1 Tax=Pseudobutyrivibrio ruminis TaxID=46206 RepID=UPI0004138A6C|nr:sensor histidine kinase [Pseudobutyrivibrio ruminis]MDC7279312.1 GHKL domain-containing protein [Butyrivibrio fibrisolvens]